MIEVDKARELLQVLLERYEFAKNLDFDEIIEVWQIEGLVEGREDNE